MKIALVHEWFVDWAGSERVVEQILACYPSADLFALVDFLPDTHRKKVLHKRAKTTFLQRMPFARSRLHWYLPWMPLAIEQLDLSGYDLVISSSHAVSKGIITAPDQMHVSYVHSPMRYAWDLQHEYLRGENGRGIRGIALRHLLHKLRIWDCRTANGVDYYIANSGFIARRIWKAYRREAHVIYPPVDIENLISRESKEDFYLCAGRLEPYKRVDLAVTAFAQMPGRRLVVLGAGPELASLKRLAGKNVEFLGYQPHDVWTSYLQRARALIFPGVEDFGITPVEAQACGTPVIAFARGGALEIVRSDDTAQPTGVYFDQQTPDHVVAAVHQFERIRDLITAEACRINAERFSTRRFRSAFASYVESRLKDDRRCST